MTVAFMVDRAIRCPRSDRTRPVASSMLNNVGEARIINIAPESVRGRSTIFALEKTEELTDIPQPGLPMSDSVNLESSAPPATASATERADLRPENINDAVIRLAGNSQDGIQSAGAFLARLAGRSDHEVMTYMTIPSTISGGPSIFQVRMGTGEVLSAGDEA